jgi:hypothetical protein
MLRKNNAWHRAVVAKHGAENIKVSLIPCTSEKMAFDVEKWLIRLAKLLEVPLVNHTDGGEGAAGYRHKDEIKKRISRKMSGVKKSEETARRMSVGRLGMKFAPEHVENIRRARIGTKSSPEAIEKSASFHRGRKRSDETKKKMSAKLFGNTRSPGTFRSDESKARSSVGTATAWALKKGRDFCWIP